MQLQGTRQDDYQQKVISMKGSMEWNLIFKFLMRSRFT